jgi:hypothetical protein
MILAGVSYPCSFQDYQNIPKNTAAPCWLKFVLSFEDILLFRDGPDFFALVGRRFVVRPLHNGVGWNEGSGKSRESSILDCIDALLAGKTVKDIETSRL